MSDSRHIAIDLRSLHTSEFSGVESFTVNVLERLLQTDRDNSYTLFYNGFHRKVFDYLHFINTTYRQTRVPNRLLNLSLKFLGWPKLERLIGECDTLFLPNWNMARVGRYTRVILTVHDLSPVVLPEMYHLKSRLWHRFINIKRLVGRADHIIAVSEFTKSALIDVLKVPANKITVAPLGIDHERYHPGLAVSRLREMRNRYNLPGDFMLFVGTLEPRKNLLRIIEAFEQIQSDCDLVIAGKPGWKWHAIISRIARSPKRRQIHLTGYVPENDKPYIIQMARFLVWPTLYEGFGLPVLEAMAVGTPVLTSQVTSLPEVVGDSALMVNPYNIEDIAAGMDLLQTNEAVRGHYIKKGLQRAAQFHWQITADKIKAVINKP